MQEYDVYEINHTRISNNHVAGLIIRVMKWMNRHPDETIIKVSVLQEKPYYLVELTHINFKDD